jgi:hypothetical protein
MIRELKANEKDLLGRVKERKELQPFFFRKAKGLHWFNELDSSGFFSIESNPKPVKNGEEGYVSIPSWMPIEYLVSTGPELSIPENSEYAKRVLRIIRESTTYAKTNSFSNYRTWWQFAKLIKFIPLSHFSIEDANLFSYWLKDPYESGFIAEEIGENWIPRLLDSAERSHHEMVLFLIDKLFEVSVKETKYDSWTNKDLVFQFNTWHVEKLLKKVPSLSGNKIGLEAVKLFESKVETALDLLGKHDWSSIWRRAIEDHDQNIGDDDAEHKLIDAFRDSLGGYAESNPSGAKGYISSLLTSNSVIKKRIAIHAINAHFLGLQELLGTVLSTDFLAIELRHEVWHLLNLRYSLFSAENREKVLKSIQALEGSNEDPAIQEKRTAYLRACWLSSIKDQDKVGQGIYEKCVALLGEEPDHPDFTSYTTSMTWQGRETPISVESLVAMNPDKLIETIKGFKPPSDERMGGVGDLANSIKVVIKSKPEDLLPHLSKFLPLDVAFQHCVVQAYREAWKENKDAQWDTIWNELFDFIGRVVKEEGFWNPGAEKPRGPFTANRNWLVKEIGELIETGTKADKHAFSPSLNQKAKDILVFLLAKQSGEEESGSMDPVTAAINSPKGSLIEALINLTLRMCRLADKASGEHDASWQAVRETFEKLLTGVGSGEYEFQTLFAHYLPNFLYISKEWTLSNFGRLFDKTDHKKWLCAINGYAYVNAVHEPIYRKLKENGDLIAALDEPRLENQVHDKIIQNICISYWNGFEDLEDTSLMTALLQRQRPKEIQHLIWFMWTLRGHDDAGLQRKVMALWPKLVGIIDFTTKDGRLLASRLSQLGSYIEDLNPQAIEWLVAIAPYSNKNHNAHFMLENLAKWSDKQPFEAQSIWIKMLDAFSYDYPEEAIQTIFKNLISKGPEGIRKAREVTDKYLKLGLENPSIWLNKALVP